MAVRKILTLDHPVLRAKAKKVSRFDTHIEKLVSDMWETMRSAEGVGLAGPQIGESLRVLVAEYKDEHVALINPEILKRSDEILLGTEGCLSIPGFVGEDVPRSAAVTVKGRDPKGKGAARRDRRRGRGPYAPGHPDGCRPQRSAPPQWDTWGNGRSAAPLSAPGRGWG